MPRKKSSQSKAKNKKPGAQPGNKNALKHGFYGKQFKAEEKKRLDESDNTDITSEIQLLRVCIDRLTNELDLDSYWTTDELGNQTRDDHYLKQLNTLSQMAQSLSTLTRTYYLTRGRGGTLEQGIMEALEELRLELGL